MTTGVLVMAYGTPGSPDEVEAYYTRIRHGRPPSPEQLADLRRRYDAIGGTSPLAERTAAQVDGVRRALDRTHRGEFLVAAGAKYQAPFIEDGAAQLAAAGVEHVIGLVLAPHESSMSTLQYMERARDALGERVAFTPIGAWWDQPVFVELVASRVLAALGRIAPDRRVNTEVIFSAHSLPERVLATGDDYPGQLRDSARLVAESAHLEHWDVAWQSAGRTSDPWIGPDILDVLREQRRRGVSDVVSCPIGFVADHLEVLFDIDIEAQGVAREIGLNLLRTESLNDDPRFTAMLADLVAERA